MGRGPGQPAASGRESGSPAATGRSVPGGPLVTLLCVVIVAASVFVCQRLIATSRANQEAKSALAELNHVKYGLFSVNEWKRQLAAILAEEIERLRLTSANERELRRHIETQLTTLIDEVDQRVREANAGSAGGRIRQFFINRLVDLEQIKQGIPGYADVILREMTNAQTTDQLKGLLNARLEQYAGATFEAQDAAQLERILLLAGAKDRDGARTALAARIAAQRTLIAGDAILMIVLTGALLALVAFDRQAPVPSRFLLLVLSLAVLLAAGVATPTIDLEAKISRLSFVLLDHPVHFENQVLYFQSKSILDVFWIMVTNKDVPMKLVGVLLITFSIVFPVLKLFSALAYAFDYRRARANPAVRFFVLQSGKWSMADVMVVAIFMAYIGFNGILSSQFGQLASAAPALDILATNGTSLQPGYYLFVAYVLLALLLPGILGDRRAAYSSPSA